MSRNWQEYSAPTGVMPHRVSSLLGAGISDTQPVQACMEWWPASRATLLVLAGLCGTGKSVAAGHLMRFCRHGVQRELALTGNKQPAPMWTTASELVRYPDWQLARLVADLRKPSLLVIDDIGQEPATDKGSSLLQDIISERHNDDRKRTVLTTNLDPKAFCDRYGERIRSRLRESGIDDKGDARWWVHCTGPDLRGAS